MFYLRSAILALVGFFYLSVFAPSPSRAIQRQRAQNWCWASAIQEVLAVSGRSRSQMQIAADLDGWPRDRPARQEEVVALLNGYGLPSYIVGRPGSPQELSRTLESGWRVIAFVRPTDGPVGHYIVLHRSDSRTVVVSDPWTGRTDRIALNALYYGWKWFSSVVIRTGNGGGAREPRCRTVRCEHPLHPRGDVSPCMHAAHPLGDFSPCQHACPGPYGPVPCHPRGDAYPCRHPVHPMGDVSPCRHRAHPGGDRVCN